MTTDRVTSLLRALTLAYYAGEMTYEEYGEAYEATRWGYR